MRIVLNKHSALMQSDKYTQQGGSRRKTPNYAEKPGKKGAEISVFQ